MKRLQCFDEKPHAPHQWTFLYGRVPTRVTCSGVIEKQSFAKRFNQDISDVVEEQEVLSISKQITDHLHKQLLTIFGSEENLRELAKFYVLEDRSPYDYSEVLQELDPATKKYIYRIDHELVLRPKTDVEIERDSNDG